MTFNEARKLDINGNAEITYNENTYIYTAKDKKFKLITCKDEDTIFVSNCKIPSKILKSYNWVSMDIDSYKFYEYIKKENLKKFLKK